jgi:transcriptional regulator with XRE-family HTH domain
MAADYPPEVSDFLVERLKAFAAGGRGRQQEIADAIGVNKSRISQLFSGSGGGLGRKMVVGACKVLQLDEANVERLAVEWAASRPRPRSETRIARDPRYPNFEDAAAFFVEHGGAPEAVEHLRETALKSATDQSVFDWIDDLKSAARRLGAERRDPVGAEKATAALAASRAAELAAEDAERGTKKTLRDLAVEKERAGRAKKG